MDNNVKVEKPSFVSADEGKDLPPVNIPFGPKDVPGTPTEELSDEPFEVVEEQPEFPGGMMPSVSICRITSATQRAHRMQVSRVRSSSASS